MTGVAGFPVSPAAGFRMSFDTAEVGLSLAEAKAFLAGLQSSMVRTQLAEHVALDRV